MLYFNLDFFGGDILFLLLALGREGRSLGKEESGGTG
jgi:hypothetical protein